MLLFIKRQAMTPYQPACNKLVEKFIGILKQILRRLCHEQPCWRHYLIMLILFVYNQARQDATGCFPFELMGEQIKLCSDFKRVVVQRKSCFGGYYQLPVCFGAAGKVR